MKAILFLMAIGIVAAALVEALERWRRYQMHYAGTLISNMSPEDALNHTPPTGSDHQPITGRENDP